MKKNNVFEILDYMFEFLFASTKPGQTTEIDNATIRQHLTNAGFDNENIDKALLYLTNVDVKNDYKEKISQPTINSARVYDKEEIDKLGIKGCNLLISLENQNKLTPSNRELIIDYIMDLPYKSDYEELKWLAMTTILNTTDKNLLHILNNSNFNQEKNSVKH